MWFCYFWGSPPVFSIHCYTLFLSRTLDGQENQSNYVRPENDLIEGQLYLQVPFRPEVPTCRPYPLQNHKFETPNLSTYALYRSFSREKGNWVTLERFLIYSSFDLVPWLDSRPFFLSKEGARVNHVNYDNYMSRHARKHFLAFK